MDFVAAVLGLSAVFWIVVVAGLSLLFPLLWLWMLVDAIVRDSGGYPGGDVSEKVLWIVLMLVFQPAAILYFFLIWKKRGRASAVGSVTADGAAAVA